MYTQKVKPRGVSALASGTATGQLVGEPRKSPGLKGVKFLGGDSPSSSEKERVNDLSPSTTGFTKGEDR